jgi:hypothetical protein
MLLVNIFILIHCTNEFFFLTFVKLFFYFSTFSLLLKPFNSCAVHSVYLVIYDRTSVFGCQESFNMLHYEHV